MFSSCPSPSRSKRNFMSLTDVVLLSRLMMSGSVRTNCSLESASNLSLNERDMANSTSKPMLRPSSVTA